MKTCTKCKITKEYAAFSKNKNRPDGYGEWCKSCRKCWADKNKERLSQKAKDNYINNKDKFAAKSKKYYENNKEKVKNNVRQWESKNWDRTLDNHRRKNRNRRAKKKRQLGIVPKDCWEILINLFGQQCLRCGSTERLELDHIYPISLGGLHDMSNLQILCKSCNCWKSNRHIIDYRPFEYYYEE